MRATFTGTAAATVYVDLGGVTAGDFVDFSGITDSTTAGIHVQVTSTADITNCIGLQNLAGVLVTTPIVDGRVKLGAQVVHALVQKGFVGESKWDSIILVGTKNDRAEDDERECFVNEVVKEFFDENNGIGKFALTSKDDCTCTTIEPRIHRSIAALAYC